jgi:hypothetical protein
MESIEHEDDILENDDDLVNPLPSNFSGKRDMIATAYALAGKPWLEVIGHVGLEEARDNSLSVGRINDPDVICKTGIELNWGPAQTTHLTQTSSNVCSLSILVHAPLADEQAGPVVRRSVRSDQLSCLLGASGLRRTNYVGAWGRQRALPTRAS